MVKVPLIDPFVDPKGLTKDHPGSVIGWLQLAATLTAPPLYLPRSMDVDPLHVIVICCEPVTVKDLVVWTKLYSPCVAGADTFTLNPVESLVADHDALRPVVSVNVVAAKLVLNSCSKAYVSELRKV